MYHFYNPNPSNKKVGDCVIRSLCKAFNKDWLTIFDELNIIARKNYIMPNGCYKEYLKNYPTINIYKNINGNKKRLTVKDVSKLQGTYILRLANHIVTVKDNCYYDLFDCGNKCCYKIWKIE